MIPSTGFPEAFTTAEDLIKFLTMVIFTVSAQHSAVNNPQVWSPLIKKGTVGFVNELWRNMWSANLMSEEAKYEPSKLFLRQFRWCHSANSCLFNVRNPCEVELTLCFHLCGSLVRLLLHDAQLLAAAEETPPNHQGPVKHGDPFGDTSKRFRDS